MKDRDKEIKESFDQLMWIGVGAISFALIISIILIIVIYNIPISNE